jgi:hypothetical protein
MVSAGGDSMLTRFGCALGIFLAAVALPGCSSPKASVNPRTESPLWGQLTPVVSVKELMNDMIDPLADNIFDAVSIRQTATGTVEKVPTTDADWEKVRIGGVSLAEGAYLLKIPRPFTPPGDLNNSVGPEAVELSPTAIRAKVERDPVEWNARIEALRNVGLEVIDIVKRKDVKELWDASDNLDAACEACHKSYWYPKEDDAFYKKLDQRLKNAPMPSHSTPR